MRALHCFNLLAVFLFASCEVTAPATNSDVVLHLRTATDQVFETGSTVTVSALVTSVRGVPVSGVTVTWEVNAGNGAITPLSSQSGADGSASAELTVGSGENRITARIQGSTGTATWIAHGCALCAKWSVVRMIENGAAWAGTAVLGHEIWVLGGEAWPNSTAAVNVFEPATATWRQNVDRLPVSLSAALTVVLNDRVYVIGGTTDSFYGLAGMNVVQAYDPVTRVWTFPMPLVTGRFHATGAALNGKIHVVGGYRFCWYLNWCEGGPVATHEIYDPALDRWVIGAPMITPRALAGAAVLDGKLYVAGGIRDSGFWSGDGQQSLEMYDPITEHWTAKAALPVRGPVQLVGAAGRLYGLESGAFDGNISRTFVYDPAADSWTRLRNLPSGLVGPSFTAVDDQVYIIGGYNSPSDRPFTRNISGAVYVLR